MSTPTETTTTTGQAPQNAPQGAPQTPQQPQAPQQPQTPQTAPQQPAPQIPPAPGEPQDVAALPDWAQKLIRDTRAEAADYRTRFQAAAPQPPAAPAPVPQQPAPPADGDVARLPQWAQRAMTDGQGAAQQLALQTAVIAAAPAAGADVSRLLDSQAAMRALSTVNPADAAAVTQAITSVLATHQHLAAIPQTAPKGGADFGTPGPGAVTAEQFAAMSYAERVDLHQSDPETYRRLAGS
ncbi:hypothetical protein RB628_06935 [Streptomyces sp. ADMS]|uniref:hypothetical protein n=1 Tax=Streptomyces sp. ADMS TaxID=3071415 RepID=UPI00296F5F3B|nr:hypothetical protein [Streptomyces sp. ADMS]MDW4905088.1 hypothetical protein [Streptomyces sp. ADMS]